MGERISKIEVKTDLMHSDILEVKEILKGFQKDINEELNKKADRSEFEFWRNWLVGGVLIAVFIGVMTLILDKFFR